MQQLQGYTTMLAIAGGDHHGPGNYRESQISLHWQQTHRSSAAEWAVGLSQCHTEFIRTSE